MVLLATRPQPWELSKTYPINTKKDTFIVLSFKEIPRVLETLCQTTKYVFLVTDHNIRVPPEFLQCNGSVIRRAEFCQVASTDERGNFFPSSLQEMSGYTYEPRPLCQSELEGRTIGLVMSGCLFGRPCVIVKKERWPMTELVEGREHGVCSSQPMT